jgi:hypothetical protein
MNQQNDCFLNRRLLEFARLIAEVVGWTNELQTEHCRNKSSCLRQPQQRG